MRAIYDFGRWLFYLVRFAFFTAYGVLHFISKPGSRLIVPVLLAGAIYSDRPALELALVAPLVDAIPTVDPQAWMLDALLVAALLILTLAYALVSRILAIVLGAFPPVPRPLPPLKRLQVASRAITSAVVWIAVPPLPARAKLLPAVHERAAAE